MSTLTIAFLTQAMLWFGTLAGYGQGDYHGMSNSGGRIGTETIEKTLKISSGSLILLDTELGNVSIMEYDGQEVRVELRLEGTPENVTRFHFTHDYFGNQVTLKGWCEKDGASRNPQLNNVQYLIMVPKDSSYAFQTATRSGNIEAMISRNTRGADLSTEVGSVLVKIPYGFAADIDAFTFGIGEVKFTPASLLSEPCLTCEIHEPDHFKGKLHGGGLAINAYAGVGNVSFELVPVD